MFFVKENDMALSKVLYFDHNATTPLDPSVFESMTPYFVERFGNSVSAHPLGWDADAASQAARAQISSLLNCQARELTFTSGATESNNWILQSFCADFLKNNPNDSLQLIGSPVEHNSVMKCLEHLATHPRIKVQWAEVDRYGSVKVESVKKLIGPTTHLMSFMWANNETGSINPISELAQIATESGIAFHCDATQAVGKIEVDLEKTQIDFLTFSAHKFYGPKGIGCTYINGKKVKSAPTPLLFGGGHERGLRAGTMNVPAIVGMGAASVIAKDRLLADQDRWMSLRSLLCEKIIEHFPTAVFNTPLENSVPNTLNLSFVGHSVPANIPGVAVSKGSACSSSGVHQSHVLKAIGLSSEMASATLRISLGRMTSEDDLNQLVELLVKSIQVRSNGPSRVASHDQPDQTHSIC